MRYAALPLFLVVGLFGMNWFRSTPRPQAATPSAFESDVAPILAHRCTPCHFAGGKMYARLPFDRPETIVKLGERLFTRIKDEQERATIRKFLAGVQR
jgi:hypothetical protein